MNENSLPGTGIVPGFYSHDGMSHRGYAQLEQSIEDFRSVTFADDMLWILSTGTLTNYPIGFYYCRDDQRGLPSYIPSQDLSCASDDLIVVGENRPDAVDNVTEVATNRRKVINDYGGVTAVARSSPVVAPEHELSGALPIRLRKRKYSANCDSSDGRPRRHDRKRPG